MTTTYSTFRTDTQTVTIGADPARVFEFVSDAANLPRWAVGFAADVHVGSDGRWIVSTGHGAEVIVEVARAREAGTVDFHMEPAPGVEAVAYARVLPNGAGAEFVFTQLQPGGMDDSTFDQQVDAVRYELDVLKAVMEVSCPN
jgi:uncharacterized protein YndB with AHSA1/START domain